MVPGDRVYTTTRGDSGHLTLPQFAAHSFGVRPALPVQSGQGQPVSSPSRGSGAWSRAGNNSWGGSTHAGPLRASVSARNGSGKAGATVSGKATAVFTFNARVGARQGKARQCKSQRRVTFIVSRQWKGSATASGKATERQ